MDTAYVRLHCVGGDFPFTTVRDAVLENYYKDKAIPGCVPVVYMAAQVLLNSCCFCCPHFSKQQLQTLYRIYSVGNKSLTFSK